MARRSKKTKLQSESTQVSAAEPQSVERFPIGDMNVANAAPAKAAPIVRFAWGRLDAEPPAAFARFLMYRDMPATERSTTRVATAAQISTKLAQRWSAMFKWVKRAIAYDNWLLELGDGLGKRAVMEHRAGLVRLGSISVSLAERTLAKQDETKLDAAGAMNIAKIGADLAAKALGIEHDRRPTAPAQVQQTVVQFGQSEPSWAVAKSNETKQNEVVVHVEEKVLERNGQPVAKALGPIDTKLPARQVPKRLLERVIDAPARPVGSG